ncbi:GerAB/ArcD/ProY family transporter [Aureibacillus halotolerans]|uniref:Spore germination protein KB n=1 Tax=Aureibacillus halotolerans TaxID=1508390 RepID=A0A4R6UAR1_9BACI|nr:endospore germination permease [Aureibacillus halotolerans]TDQ41989.1 spore germination protein KB [Aureibacillus halotolerans]
MQKTLLSNAQVFLLLSMLVIATMVLLGPTTAGEQASADMWLSPVYCLPVGFLVGSIALGLHGMYPKHTPAQYMRKILGPYAGSFLIVCYLLFYIHFSVLVLQEFTIFSSNVFLVKTPNYVIMALILFTSAYAVAKGIETVARVTMLIIPVYLIFFILGNIFLIPDLDMGNFFPVLPEGLMPSFKGSIPLSAWFMEGFSVAFLLPYIKERKGVWRSMLVSFSVMTLVILFVNLIVVLLFGSVSANFPFPLMSAFRYVSVGNFLEHMESIVVVLWTLGVFIKLSILLFITVNLMADLFQVKHEPVIVWPIALFVLSVANWAFPTLPMVSDFYRLAVVYYFGIMLVLVPLLLYGIGRVRKVLK